jgi:4-carboxymuconolactone decarboxylase
MEVLTRIDGEGGQKVIDSLAGISPEVGHQVVAGAFGDI